MNMGIMVNHDLGESHFAILRTINERNILGMHGHTTI